MKLRFLTAVVLFMSSYAPLGFILATLDFNWKTHGFNHATLAWNIIAWSAFAAVLPFYILRKASGGQVATVNGATHKSAELIGYALPYLVTFIGLKLEEPSSVVGFCLFMLLLGALTIRTQAVWINPLLALAGYRLYEAQVTFEGGTAATVTLISPGPLKVGSRCRLQAMTEFQLYATETDIDRKPTADKSRGNGGAATENQEE